MSSSITAPEKVFISYTHDSPEHEDRVFDLSERLRAKGIDCRIDQYEDSPPQGWPKWMTDQIDWADFVIVICTELYAKRASGKEDTGIGRGGKWEGMLTIQDIYDHDTINTKFLPVLFSSDASHYIPKPLRGVTYYDLSSPDGELKLYSRITNQPLINRGQLGPRETILPRRRPSDPLTTNTVSQSPTHSHSPQPSNTCRKSSFSYSDVTQRFHNTRADLKTLLHALEEDIINGRDDPSRRIPVYLTKSRIKSINSIYLKTKRKHYSSLDEITDYAGLRILCLFEQDLFDVHKFLITTLADGKYDLKEFKIFNWDPIHDVHILKQEVDRRFSGYIYDPHPVESGYRSLHYIVTQGYKKRTYFIEIQLRTLLQDVWGELEHALSYKKGNIHPHIKKSFKLLARDIQTNDMLLTHLRHVRDREACVEAFAAENAGPYKVFGYEEEFIPAVFKVEGQKQDAWQKYQNHVRTKKDVTDLRAWVQQGRTYLQNIDTLLTAKEASESDIMYIRDMETAFLLFTDGHLGSALDIYKRITDSHPMKFYVPYFRVGEILYIRGDIENALVAFDKCEEIIDSYQTRDHVNAYRVKIKLANIYWLLGNDFIPIAVQEVCEAEKIFLYNSSGFEKRDRFNLLNNLCWYHLEKYIITGDEEDFKEACRRYEAMDEVLNDKEAGREYYDTAMWFFYQRYLRERKNGELTKAQEYLEKARELCRMGRDLEMYSTNKITISNMIRSHIQEIMGER